MKRTPLKNVEIIRTELRLPKELHEKLQDYLYKLKKSGQHISQNEFIIQMLKEELK